MSKQKHPTNDHPTNDHQSEWFSKNLCVLKEGERGIKDYLTLGQAFEGISIFGGTGSGKTSGSGKTIAKAMLKLGMGGLVLTAKPDERELWEKYAKATNRENDLIIINTSLNSKTLNLLSYEYNKNKNEGTIVHELANVLNSAIDSMQTSSGNKGDEFWIQSSFQALVAAIDMLLYAYDDVDITKIVNFIRESPSTIEQVNSFFQRIQVNIKGFWEETFYKAAKMAPGPSDQLTERDEDFYEAKKFWIKDFPSFAPETRASVISILMARLSGLLHSPYRRLFSSETNVKPEDTFGEEENSKIIIVDIPIKKFGESGRFAQILFKSIWQRAVERRNVEKGKPAFLWADEAQYFVTKGDLQFQQTARSSQVVTVYLSQSIANYQANLGESSSNSSNTDALMGNFQTKIFHANGCHVTNRYAEDVFGKKLQTLHVENTRVDYNEEITGEFPIVPAQNFTNLKQGGNQNNKKVEGYVFQSGRIWDTNPSRNYIVATFDQND
ncbi:MAG: type IV secretory system conjugative DNA transfer family protein [Thermoguttaceae bacterium]|nr:type IV secretory system conjugative DNA transfer family protein [Thermoguttaceae bacterium]